MEGRARTRYMILLAVLALAVGFLPGVGQAPRAAAAFPGDNAALSMFVRDVGVAVMDPADSWSVSGWHAFDGAFAHGTGTWRFYRTDGDGWGKEPAWSAGGTQLAVSISQPGMLPSEPGYCSAGGSGIWADGFGCVVDTGAMDVSPTWSPDGTKIAFISSVSGSSGLYLVDLTTSPPSMTTLTTMRSYEPSWSPDGSQIAFSYATGIYNSSREIATIAPDGSGLTLLTSNAVEDGGPDWSPDGSQIVFHRRSGGGLYDQADIWVMNADGTGQTAFQAAAVSETDPAWSPDGSLIAYDSESASDSTQNVFTIPVEGGTPTQHSFMRSGSDQSSSHPAWQPAPSTPEPPRLHIQTGDYPTGFVGVNLNPDTQATISVLDENLDTVLDDNNDPLGPWTVPVDAATENGRVDFDFGDFAGPLEPGWTVQVSTASHGVLSMTITDLVVTGWDAGTGLVYGTTNDPGDINFTIFSPEDSNRHPTVTQVGSDPPLYEWVTDFNTEPSTEPGTNEFGGPFTWEEGNTCGAAEQWNGDGLTMYAFGDACGGGEPPVGAPIGADILGDILFVEGFTPLGDVRVTLTRDPDGPTPEIVFNEIFPTDDGGNIPGGPNLYSLGVPVDPGMRLTATDVTDPTNSKTVDLAAVRVDAYDPVTRVLRGFSPPIPDGGYLMILGLYEHGASVPGITIDPTEHPCDPPGPFGTWCYTIPAQYEIGAYTDWNAGGLGIDFADTEFDGTYTKLPTFRASGQGDISGAASSEHDDTTSVDIIVRDTTGAVVLGDQSEPFTVPVSPLGEFEADFLAEGVQLEPGYEVTVIANDTGFAKTLVLDPLRIDGVDVDLDTVFGVASEGAYLEVEADGWLLNVQAGDDASDGVPGDGLGSWVADFSIFGPEGFDLVDGMFVRAAAIDPDLDVTWYEWYGEEPPGGIAARFTQQWLGPPFMDDTIEGGGSAWGEAGEVTITVSDIDGSEIFATTTPVDGLFNHGNGDQFLEGEEHAFHFYEFPDWFEFEPGWVVTVSGGGVTKELVVSDHTISDVDADIVRGTADPGTAIVVYGCQVQGEPEQWPWGGMWNRRVYADEFGAWEADFTIPGEGRFDLDVYGEQPACELEPGVDASGAAAHVIDDDFDESQRGFYTPRINASVTMDWINPGFHGPEARFVEIYDVDHSTLLWRGEVIPEIEPNGHAHLEVGWETHGIDLTKGMLIVTPEDDHIGRAELVVEGLTVDEVDPEADRVVGTAAPLEMVYVSAGSDLGHCQLAVEAAADGGWTADFAVEQCYDESGDPFFFDVLPREEGGYVNAEVRDAEGDATFAEPVYPVIFASITSDWMSVEEWWGDTTVAVDIDGLGSFEVEVAGGFGWLHGSVTEIDLVAGMLITATGDVSGTVKQLLLADGLSFTLFDYHTDQLAGTAPPHARFVTGAGNETSGCGLEWQANERGEWLIDFMGVPCEDEEGPFFLDLVPSMGAGMQVPDEDGDGTVVESVHQPVIAEMAVVPSLLEVGYEVELTATFTDIEVPDSHTASIDWGDGATTEGVVAYDAEPGSGGTVHATYTYESPGVYEVALTITDSYGGSGSAEFRYVVVYDPSGGFVTGGGWIDSPTGAYAPDPDLSGRASFGFVSKYKKGAQVPTGSTEFQFSAGDLNFHSDSYQWLVISGARAQYKGVGTVNGAGEYLFRLVAMDAQVNDSDAFEVDGFRIKIWTEDDNGVETVLYDNCSEDDDWSSAGECAELGGGSIVVHQPKQGSPH